MPRRKEHEKLSRALLGKSYSDVHAFMDSAHNWMGARHRRFFTHTPAGVACYSLMLGDLRAFLAGMAHLVQDRTKRPNRTARTDDAR